LFAAANGAGLRLALSDYFAVPASFLYRTQWLRPTVNNGEK
jgi:hypothetical protein